MKRQVSKYIPVALAGLAAILLAALAACGSPQPVNQGPGPAATTIGGNGSAAREGGGNPQIDGGAEESGQQFGLTDTYDRVRAGARLTLAYDAAANAFSGTVVNTTNAILPQVRVEVHLSNGVELGPTPPVDLMPGQALPVHLPAGNQSFFRWGAHPEVGGGKAAGGEEYGGGSESGEHSGGEYRSGESGEHSSGRESGEHSSGRESGEHSGGGESGEHREISGVAESGGGTSQGVVAAAQGFLNSLSDEQRAAAMYAFDDPRRSNWSNLPAEMSRRNGVRIRDLEAAQQAALGDFLATALSPEGYATVQGVVGAEDALGESWWAGLLGWGSDNYFLAFFGEPATDQAWGWQFGGHHLGVNVSVVGGRSYLSPTFVGIDPAVYERDGVTAMPLAAQAAAGRALFQELAGPAQQAARLDISPAAAGEVLTGAGQDGVIPAWAGSKAGDWTAAQRQQLRDTIALWVGMLPAESAQLRMAEIAVDLEETSFAWHSAGEGGGPIYYRIQGPTLIIEFSNEDVAAEGGHYHSVYRNPLNEYGSGAAGGG